MPTQQAHIREEANFASCAPIHSRHPSTSTISGSLPTDSMVTVRLSDPQLASTSKTALPVGNHVAPSDCQPLEEHHTTGLMHSNSVSDIDHDTAIFDEGSQDIEGMSTDSVASIVEEELSIRTSGTIRSRSDTSGSFSSNGSAQVDWDELERSEEKAPRNEGSDEVQTPTRNYYQRS